MGRLRFRTHRPNIWVLLERIALLWAATGIGYLPTWWLQIPGALALGLTFAWLPRYYTLKPEPDDPPDDWVHRYEED